LAAAQTATAARPPTEPPPELGRGGTLRIAATTFPDTLDPQDSSFANEVAVAALNYAGLTRFDKDLRTVPAAAEKWEVSQDATEFTFHLRDGLKYSDGSPLTSRDFADAVKRSLDPRGVVGDYQVTFS